MFIVVTYDISVDGRRASLHKRLKKLLRPVQLSVFQGDLPDARWNQLEALLTRGIDPRRDSVRVYSFCRSCAGLVRCYGVAPEEPDPRAPIVVGP